MAVNRFVLCALLGLGFVASGAGEMAQDPEAMSEEEFDPLDSHAGIFKALDWTPAELRRISDYHALAEYQKLIELVKEKLATSDIDVVSEITIRKFLTRMRPPAALRTLLSKKDKHKMKSLHQRGQIGEAMSIMRARLNQLPKKDRSRVLQYFGYPADQE
ncbi:hypothetical protein L596_010060 [Steinernema carpocapsae]|uniref:Uncharacterized protein n=1 Tax=Steinernema carpocapsae TaxID=34508 RepID=A0A4U5PH83_STECR|nr:hypothetical protein L596_010060 [Steinernema carpocapsae]